MASQVEIILHHNGENNGDCDRTPSGRGIPQAASVDAPEKKLALFALRLAIIQIIASSLVQLAFIWANVILLGGFATNLKPKDFWFVTAILVVQGTSLFTHYCELESPHQSTRTLPANTSRRQNQSHLFIPLQLVGAAMQALSASQPSHRRAYKMQTKRTCLPTDVPLLPYAGGWVLVSKNISLLIYWLQIFVSAACVALSLMRVRQQDYGDEAQINGKSALNVFYGLALAHGLIFLLGKGYWGWTIEYKKLVERVSKDCEDLIDMISLRRFFYDTYSQCINGSIFYGLKMDLVSFAEELLHSDSSDEQIIGIRILQRFVENPQFAADTLRKIGSSTPVIERLIEMLNWKDHVKQDIRRSASMIVSKLASEKQQAMLVATIPGAIESIASLLHTGERIDEASPTAVIVDKEDFRLFGLLILKRLARYHDNCQKIWNAPGLLAKIIHLTSASKALLSNKPVPELQIKVVHLALQVVKILASAMRETEKILRRDISEIAYLASNIWKILQYGQSHLKLQMLGLQILTSLAMNEEVRKKIEATEGMLRFILRMSFQPVVTEEMGMVCNEAGEILVMLLLDNEKHCKRLLRVQNDVVRRLVNALDNPTHRVNAARILRGLFAYSALDRSDRCQIVAIMPMVLKTIMEEKENEKFLEVSIGLAIQILKYSKVQARGFEYEIERAGIKVEEFVVKLVEILQRYENPESKIPKMRRFVIELANALIEYDGKYLALFGDFRIKDVLIRIAEITSELECFSVSLESGQLSILEESISFTKGGNSNDNLALSGKHNSRNVTNIAIL